FEKAHWGAVKLKIFEEATEIFLRLLRGDVLSSDMVARRSVDGIELAPRWVFPKLKIIPQEPRMDLLRLSIGSHDPHLQELANTILPVGVFNLSITTGAEIEETNLRMETAYMGQWHRRLMPRTVLVFIADDAKQAAEEARDALTNYWRALEGTLDEEKVRKATSNALIGDASAIAAQMGERFHPEDRLMLWFDFNNHDSKRVMKNMSDFRTHVGPQFA